MMDRLTSERLRDVIAENADLTCRIITAKQDDAERVTNAIKASDGKRLMYRESVDNPSYLVG